MCALLRDLSSSPVSRLVTTITNSIHYRQHFKRASLSCALCVYGRWRASFKAYLSGTVAPCEKSKALSGGRENFRVHSRADSVEQKIERRANEIFVYMQRRLKKGHDTTGFIAHP